MDDARFLRRFACLLLAPALLLALLTAQASASPATDLIRGMADQAIETLRETEGDLAAREDRLRVILAERFDMSGIGRFVIGRYWKQASEEQRQDYQEAFADYVVATYARRLGGYAGETLEITGETKAGDDGALVATRIVRPGAPPIPAEWRVITGEDGTAKIVDVVVEGLSMSITQREEFAAVARQHGVEGLIHVLHARAGRLGAQ